MCFNIHRSVDVYHLLLTWIWINSFFSFFFSFCLLGMHARTTRVLMAMVIPGHIIFIYLCAAMLQVAALLYIAYIMIHWMWKRKIDPDNSAIPYLTAMGDLLGISLLAIAFQFLYLVGDQDSDQTIAPWKLRFNKVQRFSRWFSIRRRSLSDTSYKIFSLKKKKNHRHCHHR